MTTVYKEIEVTSTEKKAVKTVCDWCGQEIKKAVQCNAETQPETEIQFKIIHPCYEDTYGDGWSIEDLCETCGEKLKQAILNLGINVKEFYW